MERHRSVLLKITALGRCAARSDPGRGGRGWKFWYYRSWCWGDEIKREWAISHNSSNLGSCHKFQCDQASSPVSRNYVHLTSHQFHARKTMYWQTLIMSVSIPELLIHMVQHWWDTLRGEQRKTTWLPSHPGFTRNTLIRTEKTNRRVEGQTPIRAINGTTNDRRFQYVQCLPTKICRFPQCAFGLNWTHLNLEWEYEQNK
jgi:hypothetical protein